MKLIRWGLPGLVALLALTGAANTAFAAGDPAAAALTPGSGAAQEAEGDAVEATAGATDVRADHGDRGDGKHRLAAFCYRLYHSDREAPALRERCAEIFGDDLPDPAALCRLLIERGADEHAVRRCLDRVTDGVDAGQICRRTLEADANRDVASILERCREHFGDATDLSPAELCRRAIHSELDGDRISSLLERCREHFGDVVSDRPGDVCRRAIAAGSEADAASIFARCREHVGQDRAPGQLRRTSDQQTDRPQRAPSFRSPFRSPLETLPVLAQ